jgi:UDP-N-acetylmuramoyl-tripeptide--D-alanyl-D-alanine ligase
MNRLAEIIAASHPKNLNKFFFRKARSINTDSRTIITGDIFLALKGKNFNGHDHILAALEKGAEFAISEEDRKEFPNDKLCLVENTLVTYHQIASAYRRSLNPIVIGITGSSGKTTTKEILQKVLSENYKVYATRENFNNEIGVPKTILEMPEDTEVLILEMAMRGLGEISLLSKTGAPNISIITNIGTAHIERLGSVENIRKAKLEIIDGMEDHLVGDLSLEKTLILDSDNFSKLKLQKIELGMKTTSFDASKNYQLSCLSSPGINADVNAVALAAKQLHLTEEEIQRGLLKYNPSKGRGEISQDKDGNIFIDDSYNANPESIRNSVQALIENFPSKRRIAVIGQIAESEDSLVTQLFSELSNIAAIELIDARALSIEESIRELKNKLDGNSAVLIKASRVAGLERILECLDI